MLKRLSMYGRNLLMTIDLKATEHYISVVLSIILYTVFRSFPLHTDWRKSDAQSTVSHRGIGGGIQIPET